VCSARQLDQLSPVLASIQSEVTWQHLVRSGSMLGTSVFNLIMVYWWAFVFPKNWDRPELQSTPDGRMALRYRCRTINTYDLTLVIVVLILDFIQHTTAYMRQMANTKH